MNRPRYIGCNCYADRRDCWRSNHIPYVGLLLSRCGTRVGVWERIFARYVRHKKFLWPDEVRFFVDLFCEKHPELRSNQMLEEMWLASGLGAYWVSGYRGRVSNIFGRNGIFDGPPKTPKPEEREEMFFRLAAMTLNQLSKGKKHDERN